jgi:amino acid transporter/GNAT superfamily N-acetyltransferase
MSVTALPRRDAASAALARDRLGVAAVVFFVMSAATPLTVVAGVVTTGYAVTGIRGIPLSFLLIGAVLGLFSVGYVAMARHVNNAGAFSAYVARGLGKPLGVGAAWVALVAYNALQCGLYGVVGAAAAPLLDQWFGLAVPWWVVALAAWAIVAGLGVQRVDLNGRVLASLLVAEVAVIAVFSGGSLANPAGGQVTVTTLSAGELFVPGLGSVLALAVLGFIGFESAVVFVEETKDPKRTVRLATYVSVVVTAVVYAVAAWAMSVATGPDQIVDAARAESTELLFNLAARHLGAAVVEVGQVLFVTSLLAAMISFHNTTARYVFALGREQVLPAWFGRTRRRSGAPAAGSLVQSLSGLVVIVIYAIAGWDPVVKLFFWGGTSGALGVLFLITITSAAVVGFFARHRLGENVWRRVVAPTAAALALLIVTTLAVVNFATLLGVPDQHPLSWMVPIGYLAVAAAGTGWGLVLRATRPDVYATIGLGPEAVVARAVPPSAVSAPAGSTATYGGVHPVASSTILRAHPGDAAAVADLIAGAFHDLPPAAWLVPEPAARRPALAGQFRILVDHALQHGHVYLTADLAGVAVWFPRLSPAVPEPAHYLPRLEAACGPWTDRFLALDDLFERHHPTEPHHHLAFLAVRPGRQHQGVGSMLLNHHHDRLDALGMAAYLEAATPANVGFYHRRGYVAREPLRLAGHGPLFWPMWREPGGGWLPVPRR